MDIQKNLLQIVRHREQYEKLAGLITYDDLDADTGDMLRDFTRFFKKNPDINTITGELYVGMKRMANEYDSDEEAELDITIFKEIEKEPHEDIVKSIVRHITTLKYMSKLEKHLVKAKLGNDSNVFESIRKTQEEFKKLLGLNRNTGPVNATLEDIFDEHDKGIKFEWHLPDLQNSMANVRTGNMVIVAARPDTGKTSFIANAVTYMAHKNKDITERPILWFNNEGKGTSIQLTAFRSALNVTYDELRGFGGKRAQDVLDSYMGGSKRLRIYDVHGLHYSELENIIEEEQPCIVVVDMLDNVKGFGSESRTDLRLEQLYVWLREAAVIYDFLALPTSQVSLDGEGEAWPNMSMLKDSKTGKQGACDGIIMIGKKHDPKLINTRYISCPKNKFKQDNGASPLCLAKVHFDFERAKYHAPEVYGG